MSSKQTKQKASILIAEDDTYIRTAYDIGFGEAGYDVILAEDGDQAVKQATKHTPDLILLDLLMPKKSGFEVLEILKRQPETDAIPVVVLSNLSQDSDEREVRRLGAIDFVVKSDHSIKDLLVIIKKYLRT
jgi:DNA-binding response OmpR family regulator